MPYVAVNVTVSAAHEPRRKFSLSPLGFYTVRAYRMTAEREPADARRSVPPLPPPSIIVWCTGWGVAQRVARDWLTELREAEWRAALDADSVRVVWQS